MKYINFGRAGIKVSRLAIGLGLREQGDEAAAQYLIEKAIDMGINLIDCANVYGPMDDRANIGVSEEILGRAIAQRRDDVIITSKAAGRIGSGPNDQGGSRFHIMREVERSLRRLQTDHIDVYLIHTFDATTPQEETVRALDDLVRSGKVRYVGCCNYKAWQVCRALWIADTANANPFMCVQNPYNLLNRQLEREMFGLVRDRGLGVMTYSPLAVGLLSGYYRPDQAPPKDSLWARNPAWDFEALMQGPSGQVVATVLKIAADLGRTPAQVALAWILAHDEVTTAIAGVSSVAELEDDIVATDITLEPEVLEQLDAVSASFV